jgi:hypothetical protein
MDDGDSPRDVAVEPSQAATLRSELRGVPSRLFLRSSERISGDPQMTPRNT